MPYIRHTFKTQYRIEVEKVHSSRYGSKGMKYNPKTNLTKEEMKKVNERNRIKKLYYKIASNFDFGDYHTVLTYRREERPTPKEARKIIKRFLRDLRKAYRKLGQELKYIITTEHLKTTIHHHLIINEIGYTAQMVKKLWEKGNAYFTVIYEHGEVKDLAAYLIKETQNSFRDEENPSGQSYSCSRNLKEPDYDTEVIDANTWLESPVPPEGYWILKSSVVSGISKVTGYPYQYYTCIKYDPEQMKDESLWIKPRKRKKKGENIHVDKGKGN